MLQFGTGYLRIKNACEKYNYLLPEWREVGPYTDIVFKPLQMEAIHEVEDRLSTKSALSQHQVTIVKLRLLYCQPFNKVIISLTKK